MADRQVNIRLNVIPEGADKVREAFRGIADDLRARQRDLSGALAGATDAGLRRSAQAFRGAGGSPAQAGLAAAVGQFAGLPASIGPSGGAPAAGGGLGQLVGNLVGSLQQALASRGGVGGLAQQVLGQFQGKPVAGGLAGVAGAALGGGGGLAGMISGGLGAAGGLIGGPMGLAVTAFSSLYPVVRQLAGAPFSLVTGGLGAVSKALSGLQGPLGVFGSAFGAVEGGFAGLKKLGDSLGPLGIGLSVAGEAGGALVGTLHELTGTLVSMAKVASPGTFERFRMVLDDTQGVIGQRMVPVLDLMSSVARTFGDLLNSILPPASEIRPLTGALRSALAELRPGLAVAAELIERPLVGALRMLAPALRGAAIGLHFLLAPVERAARLAGLDTTLKSSVGAAARPASFVGLEDIGRQAAVAAYSEGGGGPQGQTASNTQRIKELLERLEGLLERATGLAAKAGDPLAVARGILGFDR